MKIAFLTYLLIVVCLFKPFHFYGQTAISDLITMNKKISSLTAYDISVDVKVFNDNSISPTLSSKGRTIKSGHNFYLSMLNKKTIINDDIMLVVDDQNKSLMYTVISKEQLNAMEYTKVMNIDSLIKSSKSVIKYVVNNSTEKKIEIYSKDDDIEYVIISLNPKSYILKAVEYKYSKESVKLSGNSKVMIQYTQFLLETKNPELLFQNKYIAKKSNHIVATKQFQSYKLLNTGTASW
jgi:hypothetical protein